MVRSMWFFVSVCVCVCVCVVGLKLAGLSKNDSPLVTIFDGKAVHGLRKKSLHFGGNLD